METDREAYRDELLREEFRESKGSRVQDPSEFITIKELFRERTMDKLRRALAELTIAAEGGVVGLLVSAFGVVVFGVQGGSLEAKLLLVGGMFVGASVPKIVRQFRQPYGKFVR